MKILANDYSANLPNATNLGQGGPGRFAHDLARAVTGAGHEYIGVVMRNAAAKLPRFKEAGKRDDARYLSLSFPVNAYLAITGAERKISAKKTLSPVIEAWIKLFRKEQPDVVLINGFSLQVWPMLIGAYKAGIPIVQKHAGIWHKEIAIYAHRFPAGARSIMRSMERDIPKYATYEVFLNKFSLHTFNQEVTKVPKGKALVIPLPSVEYPKKITRKPSNQLRIGVVARWDKIKNHAAILDLAERIAERKLPWKIHAVVHIPPTKIDEDMKERYRSNVVVHAPMSHTEILDFFEDMDIAILPSRYDVSPTVVLEADSRGVGTLISPNVGWVDTYKQTGNSKWITDFSDIDKVIDKISNLAYKKLSPEFQRYVRREHAPKRVFTRYLDLFKTAAKRTKL